MSMRKWQTQSLEISSIRPRLSRPNAGQIILENRGGIFPVKTPRKVWLHNVDAAVARSQGSTVVASPEEADLAILRVDAPFETLHPHHFFGAYQHEGRPDFRDGEAAYEAIIRAASKVPTIVAINLDRPAVLTNVRDKPSVLIATFGASDAAVLDVIRGKARPPTHYGAARCGLMQAGLRQGSCRRACRSA